MFRDVGCVERRPCKEMVIFDGGKPGRLNWTECCSMEKGNVVFDAMANAVDII